MIGDELGRLRNPVLNRRMFTTPQQRAAMARGPVGINASGPELIRATSTTGNPFIDQGLVNRRQVATQNPVIDLSGPTPILTPAQLSARNRGTTTNQGEFEGVGPQTDPGMTPPTNQRSDEEAEESRRIGGSAPGILDDVPDSFIQPKPKTGGVTDKSPDEKKGKKSAKSAMDEVLDRIAGMSGTEDADKKTRKQKFQEAKDFLVEAGVTQAKDVRTDRDFLMMLGGLKFAAGSGTGSMSQDAVSALSSVLGTFASGKQEERQLEQKLNMAAAERVLAQEDTAAATAAARQLAMDKLSITAALQQAELDQDPKMIREVEGIMAKTGKSFEDSLALYNSSSAKTPGAEVQAAKALMARGIPESTARLLARDTDLVSKILTGEITSDQLNQLLNDLATVQSSGNTGGEDGTNGNIPLTGTEDQNT